MNSSDEIALAGAVIAAIALFVSWYAIYRGNRNSSAATLVALNDGFRQGWQRYLDAKSESNRHYEFAELANLFEIACAILHEGSLFGVSRKLTRAYLTQTLKLIMGNGDARERLRVLRDAPDTFEYLKKFLLRNWQEISREAEEQTGRRT